MMPPNAPTPLQPEEPPPEPPPADPGFAPPPPVEDPDEVALAQHAPAMARGISWLWWVVGLSVVNVVTAAAGWDRSFAIALSFSLFPVAIAQAIVEQEQLQSWVLAIGVVIGLVPIAFLVALTLIAKRGAPWAWILAMVVYAADAALFLAIGDWLSVLLHGLCIYYVFLGWRAAAATAEITKRRAGAPVVR